MPIGTPAGILNVLVIANTGQANAALTKTRAAFRLTGVSAQESAAVSSAAWKKVGAGAALAAGFISAAAGKVAIDFDKSMRNVNSIAQLPEKQFQKLEKSALKLAGPAAQAPVTIAEGMYALVSSGFSAKESLEVVEQSARGATAGLTDTAVSTKAVAAVLNAYQRPARDAKDVTDTLFRTVDKGVITFEELAQNIGDTLPFAATLGVTLDEVGAATATLTRQGLSASETMTRIRNVLQTLIKPGTDLQSTFKELGTSGSELVKKEGLQGALDTLIGTTDGTKEAVAKLFPNIRALGGALALTGENSKVANKLLDQLKNHSGATSRALSQQSKSVSFQWNRAKAEVTALAIEFGNVLLPVFFDAIGVFVDVGKVVFDVAQALAHLDGTAAVVVLSMGGAALAVGAFIKLAPMVVGIASNIGFLASMMGTAAMQGTVLTTTVTLLGTAMRAHPIMTIAVGVGLAVGAIAGLISILGGLDSKMQTFGKKDLFVRIRDDAKEATSNLNELVQGHRAAVERVKDAREEDRNSSDRLKKAEEALIRARKQYGPQSREATKAEHHFTEAKKDSAQASRKLERAERLPRFQRQHMAEELERIIGPQKAYVKQLEHQEKRLFKEYKSLKRNNASWEDRDAAFEKWQGKAKTLDKAQSDVNKTLAKAEQLVGPKFARRLDELGDKLATSSRQVNKSEQNFDQLNDAIMGIRTTQAAPALIDLQEQVDRAGAKASDARADYERLIRRGLEPFKLETRKVSDQQQESSRIGSRSMGNLNNATVQALKMMGNATNNMLLKLGLKEVNFSAGTKKEKKQAGGRLVGGLGSGDKINLLAEPGEVVWNREAVKAMGGTKAADQPNMDFPRFQKGGAVGGGLNFALGPYDIPPIQYAADHAGTNSHVHITGTTTPWVIAIGKQLQQMGFSVGEHPAFGGVLGDHSATGGHYDALAIDVNSAADETRSEVSNIAKILGGKGGIVGVALEKIKRAIITGPDGPLKDVAQGLSDRVHSGITRMLRAESMSVSESGVGSFAGVKGSGAELMRNISAKKKWSFPDWWELDSRETGHGADLFNESSGASLRAQFLPMNFGKYGPGSDPAQNPSMDEQIKSMAAYITDRYNNPTAALSWHDAHNWYAKGGIVGMQEGGPVSEKGGGGPGLIKNFVQSFKQTEGAGDRKKLVKSTLDTIRNRAAFGVSSLTNSGSLSGRLLELRSLADRFQEFADNSSALDGDAPWELVKDMKAELPWQVKEDNTAVQAFKTEAEAQGLLKTLQESVLGRFHGKTEGGWLGGIDADPGKLQVMLKLRNRLIEATQRIKSVKEVIQRMIEHVEQQVRLVREAIKAGAKMRADLEEERKQLQKRLETATDDQEKSREAIRKRIDKEMGKDKKKRDMGLVESLRKNLSGKSSEKDAIRDELARNHDKMQHLLGAQADRGALMDALRGKIKQGFKDRLSPLTSGTTTVADELGNVQGSVRNFDFIKGIPEFGLLGGDIFETQRRLMELQFQPSDFTDQSEDSGSSGGMNIQDLLRFAEAVKLGAFGPSKTILGYAAGGIPNGLAVVGEQGPELYNFKTGRIHSNPESQQILGNSLPSTIIIQELKIGDTTIAEEVEFVLDERDGKQVGKYRAGRPKV